MKKNIRFFAAVVVLLSFAACTYNVPSIDDISISSTSKDEQTSCYQNARDKGILAYEQKNYSEAKKYFNAANSCAVKPQHNDIDEWIAKCDLAMSAYSHRKNNNLNNSSNSDNHPMEEVILLEPIPIQRVEQKELELVNKPKEVILEGRIAELEQHVDRRKD